MANRFRPPIAAVRRRTSDFASSFSQRLRFTMKTELTFPVHGTAIPAEHYYGLYSALSHAIPAFHQPGSELRFGPISGEMTRPRFLQLNQRSCLRVRVPAEHIALVLPLVGRSLDVAGHTITLGVPTVMPLRPVTTLAARVVTYKNATDPARFLEVTRWKLDALSIGGEPGILLFRSGKRQNEPRRQVLRIKGKQLVGYALQVAGLTAEESIRLQEEGLGGRTRMGCGFFLPYRPRES
jgi:CRISPR-associated endonuclease/helicase Cas3